MQKTNLAPPVSGHIGYPLGFAATVTVTIVAVAAHGTAHPDGTLAALAVTVAAVAAVTALPAGLATAVVAWALQSGFVLGRHGDLVFTRPAGIAAAVLCAAAVLAYVVSLAVRYARRTAPVVIPAPRAAIRVPRRVA